jgi:glycosyltransferase involved in cell wall biosynthesis
VSIQPVLASVLIDNFNYGRYLKKCIDSLLAQTYSRVEIVVVDDGSTDESREVIAQYGTRVKAVLKPNGGQSSALNAGFAVCTGDVICLLDSDDWFFPDKVSSVVSCFEAHPKIEWVFDPVMMIFPDGSQQKQPPHPNDIYVDVRKEAPRGKAGPIAPPHSGLSFKRSLIQKLLPMTDDIRMGSDNFLKFASMTLSPGLQLSRPLTAQRIHDSNAGTRRTDRLLQKARQHLLIARELRLKVPVSSRLADKIFSRAAADYIRSRQRDKVCDDTVALYLKICPWRDVVDIVPRTIYHVFRRMGTSG